MPSLDELAPILGQWRTSGDVRDDVGGIESRINGTDSYRTLPGEAWIAHEVDVRIGGGHIVAHELIGGEHPDGGWSMHSFDSSPEPGLMRLTVHEPGVLLVDGGAVRSWFNVLAGPDFMTTRWERRVGSTWVTWMDMRFDRVASSVR
ncbi:hypothetical protein GCM10007304_25890 [Rhodococcoides trifolii]|uniref:DUF1579 domain-containing protein n=1 Tax=Rhodococcoides trifolii TaxID=908250 RepID=A0A917D4H1_9NOCA|nr:hypothetical protein [Rhodococcus trifolii]GGG10650.1 hypothetical protein GCM10007304_25890 [Rhodococcus trifolii]